MLSESDIELAHPEAFDFVFGNLPGDKRAEFSRHRAGCRYCQGVVDEYSDIGQIMKNLPPHVEPPADLEDRTVAAMVAALAGQRAKTDRRPDSEDQAATRVYPIPEVHPAEPETRVQPRPQLQPPAELESRLRPSPASQPATAGPQARPMVTRLPVRRRYPRRLTAVVAAAAAVVTAAIVVPLSLGGGRVTPAQATVVIPLHATAAAKVFGVGTATARATARQVGESWTFDLTVSGLKPLPGDRIYECWYAESGSTPLHPLLVTGGSFVVGDSGSAAVTMTSGVDPRDFRVMEITAESPGNGALHGPVLLIGQTL
jgi:Anti-sigma-K factor rskA